MDDVIRVQDRFYILATSSRVDDRTRVLKEGDTFAVFDRYGDIHPYGLGEQGLYHEGTRFLSRLEVGFGKDRTLLLSSTVRDDNAALGVDLANPDLRDGDAIVVPADTVHLFRSAFLWDGVLYQRLQVHNFALQPVQVPLRIGFEADFRDIFEVRGMRRERRGAAYAPAVTPDGVVVRYEGLDGLMRAARLVFDPVPPVLGGESVEYVLRLAPKADVTLYLTVACEVTGGAPARVAPSYDAAFDAATRASGKILVRQARVESSNEQLNDWLNRSFTDMAMMLTETPDGPYPYAGIPWFSTVFGRDGIITALQTLWIDPAIARGVLSVLAATQATESDPERDAEPGKILHELRGGEMAALREIPFGRYYGTVDATPLFVVLAGAYYQRTGDRAFVERLWPHVEAALGWIERSGDADRDGFVEYHRRTAEGLANQGWKDSQDSVFHADGTLAQGPIALCEVQAYVYAAKRAAAELAMALGAKQAATGLVEQAQVLQERFERAFWSDELGTYVLALDGDKRPCAVSTSNAGHALFGGIAHPERAARVARTLLGDAMFSGWGVRTLATSAVRYNPMSYHNGSIWPHDNALIAQGFARYRLQRDALALFTALFDASLFVELNRLPELFCGFVRRRGEGPTRYPVACSPQAWAVGTPFMLLQSALGLTVRALEKQVVLVDPIMPPFLKELSIANLTVGDATVDVKLLRRDDDVSVEVTRQTGDVDVVIHK